MVYKCFRLPRVGTGGHKWWDSEYYTAVAETADSKSKQCEKWLKTILQNWSQKPICFFVASVILIAYTFTRLEKHICQELITLCR